MFPFTRVPFWVPIFDPQPYPQMSSVRLIPIASWTELATQEAVMYIGPSLATPMARSSLGVFVEFSVSSKQKLI